MSKILKLTLAWKGTAPGEEKMVLNFDRVQYFHHYAPNSTYPAGQTILYFDPDDTVVVQESMEQILSQLEGPPPAPVDTPILFTRLRLAFADELSVKTGWGRNEVQGAFERAVRRAVSDNPPALLANNPHG